MKAGDKVRQKKTDREGVVLRTDDKVAIVNFIVPDWPFPVMVKMLASNLVIVRKKESSEPEDDPAPF